MKVSLETETTAVPLRCRVVCDESWTELSHFDKAIATLKVARAWFAAQKKAAK